MRTADWIWSDRSEAWTVKELCHCFGLNAGDLHELMDYVALATVAPPPAPLPPLAGSWTCDRCYEQHNPARLSNETFSCC